MKRHTITLGATTTAGGKVTSASSHGSINGVAIALEGDVVFCPACKAEGRILCVAPRRPEKWNGKNVALENDLCNCACPSPPRLVPNQAVRYQITDDTATSTVPMAHVAGSRTGVETADDANTGYNDRYALIDEETGMPLINTEYALRRENGKVEFGTTDAQGRTHLLTTEVPESVHIYL